MRRLLLALLAAFLFVSVSAPTAFAEDERDPIKPYNPVAQNTVCASAGAPGDGSWSDTGYVPDGTSYLPSQRWMEATTRRHTRLSSGIADDVVESSSVQVSMMAIRLGNIIEGTTASFADFVGRAKLICVLGPTSDKLGASFGDAITGANGSGGQLLAIVVAAGIVSLLFRSYKRAGWRGRGGVGAADVSVAGGIGSMILVLGMAAVMLNGAHKTNAESGRFGVMSPGWFADQANAVTQDVGSAVTAGTLALIYDNGSELGSGADGPAFEGVRNDCVLYRNYLIDQYKASYGDGSTNYRAATAIMFDALWERSGLAAWKQIQYGTKDPRLGDKVFCRILEHNAQVSPEEQARITLESSGVPVHEAAFDYTTGRSIQEDMQTMAWVICDASNADDVGGDSYYTVNPVFEGVEGEMTGGEGNCDDLFNDGNKEEGRGGNGVGDNDNFDFDGGMNGVDNVAASDFVTSLHGRNVQSGMMASATYVFSAVILGLTIGLLMIGVLIAQLIMSLGIIFIIPIAFLDVLPRKEGQPLRIVGFARKMFGSMLFSSFYLWLVGIIIVFANVITSSVTVLSGENSSLTNMISGMSAGAAAYLIHRVGKKSGIGSPFSPTGAMKIAGGFANAPGSMMGAAKGMASKATGGRVGGGAGLAKVAGGNFLAGKLLDHGRSERAKNQTNRTAGQNMPKIGKQSGRETAGNDVKDGITGPNGEDLGLETPQWGKGAKSSKTMRLKARGARSGVRLAVGAVGAGAALAAGAMVLPAAAAGLVAARAVRRPAIAVQRRMRTSSANRVDEYQQSVDQYQQRAKIRQDELWRQSEKDRRWNARGEQSSGGPAGDTSTAGSEDDS